MRLRLRHRYRVRLSGDWRVWPRYCRECCWKTHDSVEPGGDGGYHGRTVVRLLRGGNAMLLLLVSLMDDAVGAGDLLRPSQGNIASLFMHLLAEDQQIRRAIGTLPPPTPDQVETRARIAMAQFIALCGT